MSPCVIGKDFEWIQLHSCSLSFVHVVCECWHRCVQSFSQKFSYLTQFVKVHHYGVLTLSCLFTFVLNWNAALFVFIVEHALFFLWCFCHVECRLCGLPYQQFRHILALWLGVTGSVPLWFTVAVRVSSCLPPWFIDRLCVTKKLGLSETSSMASSVNTQNMCIHRCIQSYFKCLQWGRVLCAQFRLNEFLVVMPDCSPSCSFHPLLSERIID